MKTPKNSKKISSEKANNENKKFRLQPELYGYSGLSGNPYLYTKKNFRDYRKAKQTNFVIEINPSDSDDEGKAALKQLKKNLRRKRANFIERAELGTFNTDTNTGSSESAIADTESSESTDRTSLETKFDPENEHNLNFNGENINPHGNFSSNKPKIVHQDTNVDSGTGINSEPNNFDTTEPTSKDCVDTKKPLLCQGDKTDDGVNTSDNKTTAVEPTNSTSS